MSDSRSNTELRDVIHERITALIQEMEQADWSARDVVFAIEEVVDEEWLPQFRALDEARAAQPDNFVSDGNEG
jgi:phenylpyruvate tautomerase PptA (4-oxalocrotonate tautomerase family)